MQKIRIIILFLAETMIFLNMAHNTITIHVQTSDRDISKQLYRNIFEKTIQARGLKLGSYVPLISFYNLISGIFEKTFFSIFMGKMSLSLDLSKSVFCRYLKK